MVNRTTIENAYTRLYAQLRRYIWSYDEVELIAKLESASMQAIPDVGRIRNCLDTLYRFMNERLQTDSELYDAYTDMYDLLKNEHASYSDIQIIREVI